MSTSENRKNTALVLGIAVTVLSFAAFMFANTETQKPSQAACQAAWDSIFNHKGIVVNLSALASNCQKNQMFEQNLDGLNPSFSIEGKAIKIGDSTYSLSGMNIQKTSSKNWFFPERLPSLEISSGNKTEELVFGRIENAEKAYATISKAISDQ